VQLTATVTATAATNADHGYTPIALSPPVYYSYPVSAPYGVSPAPIASYSPTVRTHIERPAPEPQVVDNPYVTQEEGTAATDQADPMPEIVEAPPEDSVTGPEPAVIENETMDPASQPEAEEAPAPSVEADDDPFGFE
jgi:hypothetical protein